jgi:hypothetical protein
VKIYNKVSEFVSPYVKKAGELIMRIAQPLLDTKFGKFAVKGLQYAGDIIAYASYKVVGATEWVVDKVDQAVNYVGKQATKLVESVGSTRVVQGAINAVNSFGSWMLSTEIFKTAVNMATYVYTKMSNFCTAVAESYQYYNQCRTMARRIAMEKQGLVDEHTILKTFQGVSQPEAKKVRKNISTDDVSYFMSIFMN